LPLREKFNFVFGFSQTVKIEFAYRKTEIYKIQLVQPKKYDNSKPLMLIVDEQTNFMKRNIAKVIEISKEKLRIVKSHTIAASNLQNYYNKHDKSFEMLIGMINIVSAIYKKID